MKNTDGECEHSSANTDGPVKKPARSLWRWLVIAGAVGVLAYWGTMIVIVCTMLFSEAYHVSMDVSSSGLVVFSAKGKGGNDLYLLDLNTKTVQPFVISPAYEDSPKFSPDGKMVVYSVSEKPLSGGHIYLKSLDSHQIIQLTSDNGVSDSEPVFSPDGSTVVFTRATRLRIHSANQKEWDRSYRYTVNVTGGTPAKLPNRDTPGYRADSSRYGKNIYFLRDTTYSYGKELWESDVDGSNAKRIADSGLFKHPLRWKP